MLTINMLADTNLKVNRFFPLLVLILYCFEYDFINVPVIIMFL